MKEKTIHLQGIGRHAATEARNLKPGDITVWNGGYTEKIVAIEPSESKKTLTATFEYDGINGKTRSTRRFNANRLVGIQEDKPMKTKRKNENDKMTKPLVMADGEKIPKGVDKAYLSKSGDGYHVIMTTSTHNLFDDPKKSNPKQEDKSMKKEPPPKQELDDGYFGPQPKNIRKSKSQRRKEAARKTEQEAKPIRSNPFSGADDIYMTPNKIAVTRTKHTSSKRGHKSVTQTKYYEQNDDNMRQLGKVTDTVRIGRKGNKGFKRLK